MKDFKLAIVGTGYGESLRPKLVYVKTKTEYSHTHKYSVNYYACVLVNVTKDFDPESEELLEIEHDTDSYQIRPKLIYRDSKGYYYKPHGKVVRLSYPQELVLKTFVKMHGNESIRSI